ncbi:unnamed protein product [Musa acuminata subsp. burmannicoides]
MQEIRNTSHLISSTEVVPAQSYFCGRKKSKVATIISTQEIERKEKWEQVTKVSARSALRDHPKNCHPMKPLRPTDTWMPKSCSFIQSSDMLSRRGLQTPTWPLLRRRCRTFFSERTCLRQLSWPNSWTTAVLPLFWCLFFLSFLGSADSGIRK